MPTSTLTSKSQTTIPAEVRQALDLKPGDKLTYEVVDGEVKLKKLRPLSSFRGALKGKGIRPKSGDPREAAKRAWIRPASLPPGAKLP